MTLSPIDWIIVAVYLAGCVVAGVWMKRYVRGVEDFAVAGRAMDVNLGIASLAATEVGIVTVMYTAQMGFTNGFAGATPGVLTAAAMFFVGLTGFVIVPLRNAGVITIPELFEKRFGTRVRWLAGLVVILGGVLNMGIFLRVGGEFLVNMTGLPPHYLEWTMTALLALVLLYTVLGGMLSVLITDYLQFLVMGLGIVITSVLVLWYVGWGDLKTAMVDAYRSGAEFQKEEKEILDRNRVEVEAVRKSQGPATAKALAAEQAETYGQSLLARKEELAARGVLVSTKKDEPAKAMTIGAPFDPVASLGFWWVLWQAITGLAVVTTWQTTITRVLSAKDARTARRVYRTTAFYWVGRFGLPGLWGAAAFVWFTSHGGLPDDGLYSLTAMPVFLKEILPVGVIGIMLAAMLAAEMSTDSGYLLTWATVIYNDLFSPLLKTPLSPRGKLLTIRVLVLLIGLFLVFYGLWYELRGGAWDYLVVTGNIYLASLFALLVGALYWRPANSWGATAAIVLGAIGPISFLVVNAIVPEDSPWQIAPAVAGLAAFGTAFGGMIVGSLVGRALGRGFAGPIGGGDPPNDVEEVLT
jgi:SSS family transporter